MSIIPNNYGVLLLPGLVPGGLEVFRELIEKVGISSEQIIDGSYNKGKYYENGVFSLEAYSECIALEVKKVRNRFTKIISIGVSFGGGLSLMLSKDLKLDGICAVSPMFTLKGIEEKWLGLLQIANKENLSDKDKRFLARFIKKAGFDKVGFTIEEAINSWEYVKGRASFMQSGNNEELFSDGFNLTPNTVIYYSEGERDFLSSEKNNENSYPFDKIVGFLAKFDLSFGDKRRKHGALHVDSNPNYAPFKKSNGPFQILTHMSNPNRYLDHAEFTKNLEPYLYLLNYLVHSIENNINLREDKTFSPEEVAWAHFFGILRGKIRNLYQKYIFRKKKGEYEDREETYMVESLIRIDQKESITPLVIILSFFKELPETFYYWLKNPRSPNWHGKDLRPTIKEN